MGGIFGEGVDLVGDRLIGCAIVGVGLPQVNPGRRSCAVTMTRRAAPVSTTLTAFRA